MPTSCCVRGCKSKGNGKIKYFRFPKDENRRLQWIQALHRENFVPTNNTLICEAHFTTNDYQKRPDLIKLTNIAVPSIFNYQNERQNTSQKKVTMDSELKSSRLPARKRHSNLSDHTYVLKLPEESIIPEDIGFQNTIISSKCVVSNLYADKSHLLDVSKSNIQTLKNVKNPGFKIPESFKITFQPPEKNWENIAMTQKKTIHDLRKIGKTLQ
uniref:THAP domain-containing protein 2 n=1 Tax=Melanaphis sacchari TaxID=742174 RepID=A0A2H8TW85_9HEMI